MITSKLNNCLLALERSTLLNFRRSYGFFGSKSFFSDVFSQNKGNGFGDDYKWHTIQDGIKLAKEENKPILIVVHKTWCGACKKLGPQFATHNGIKELSKNFVMVNSCDSNDCDARYSPDGAYVPRIVFAEPTGKVIRTVTNPAIEQQRYKFFYSNPNDIVRSMSIVLEQYRQKEEMTNNTKEEDNN